MELNIHWVAYGRSLLLWFLLSAHALDHSSHRRHHHVIRRRMSGVNLVNESDGVFSDTREVKQNAASSSHQSNSETPSSFDQHVKSNSGVMITFSGESTKRLSQTNTFLHSDPSIGNSAKNRSWFMSYTPGTYEMALNNTFTNISAQIGREAFLHCRVGHLGDTQISWIRRRDWHVLSIGTDLITHDNRFFVVHDQASRDWRLHIRRVTDSDNGTYECQVSTGSGIISMFVKLNIVTPVIHILGSDSYHANKGSTLQLTCSINQSFYTSQNVIWRHNGEVLNFRRYTSSQVTIENTEKIVQSLDTRSKYKHHKIRGEEEETQLIKNITSHLKIDKADQSHSGNYICSTPDGLKDSITVFITEGDKIAAVQRIDSSAQNSFSSGKLQIFVLLIFILFNTIR